MDERWKIARKSIPPDGRIIFIFEGKCILCYKDVRYWMFNYKRDKYWA